MIVFLLQLIHFWHDTNKNELSNHFQFKAISYEKFVLFNHMSISSIECQL